MDPNLWPTTFFLEMFVHLTSELMLKNRIRAYIIVMSFNIFSVKSASLYNTSGLDFPGHII